jgi:putative hemolysin
MDLRSRKYLSILIILGALCLTECASESKPSTNNDSGLPTRIETEYPANTETRQPTITETRQSANTGYISGLANPASGYCQGLGFQEESRENETGQFSVCIFTDGSECDSWDFLEGHCGQEFSYCEQQDNKIKPDPVKGNYAICVFEDYSICSEWLYFLGECKPGENQP